MFNANLFHSPMCPALVDMVCALHWTYKLPSLRGYTSLLPLIVCTLLVAHTIRASVLLSRVLSCSFTPPIAPSLSWVLPVWRGGRPRPHLGAELCFLCPLLRGTALKHGFAHWCGLVVSPKCYFGYSTNALQLDLLSVPCWCSVLSTQYLHEQAQNLGLLLFE